jgi:membrane protease YdiL (CAAX protease family)
VLPRGLPAAAILYGSYLVLLIAASGVAFALDPAAGKDRRLLVLLDGGTKVAALLLLAFVLRTWDGTRDPGAAPARSAVPAGLAAGVAFLPLAFGTLWLQETVVKAMHWTMETQGLVALAQEGSGADFAVVFVSAVVLAPVFEEMVFRVLLYSGLRAWTGPVPAAVISASLFSLSHLQPVAYPVTFLLGLCLAFLRERTGGRSAPIAMHACYNSVQMAGILALRAGGGPPTGG